MALVRMVGICCGRLWNRGAPTFRSVAINDLGPVETNAHLMRFDSVRGRFPGEVPALRRSGEQHCEGVDIALECTDIFAARDRAATLSMIPTRTGRPRRMPMGR